MASPQSPLQVLNLHCKSSPRAASHHQASQTHVLPHLHCVVTTCSVCEHVAELCGMASPQSALQVLNLHCKSSPRAASHHHAPQTHVLPHLHCVVTTCSVCEHVAELCGMASPQSPLQVLNLHCKSSPRAASHHHAPQTHVSPHLHCVVTTCSVCEHVAELCGMASPQSPLQVLNLHCKSSPRAASHHHAPQTHVLPHLHCVVTTCSVCEHVAELCGMASPQSPLQVLNLHCKSSPRAASHHQALQTHVSPHLHCVVTTCSVCEHVAELCGMASPQSPLQVLNLHCKSSPRAASHHQASQTHVSPHLHCVVTTCSVCEHVAELCGMASPQSPLQVLNLHCKSSPRAASHHHAPQTHVSPHLHCVVTTCSVCEHVAELCGMASPQSPLQVLILHCKSSPRAASHHHAPQTHVSPHLHCVVTTCSVCEHVAELCGMASPQSALQVLNLHCKSSPRAASHHHAPQTHVSPHLHCVVTTCSVCEHVAELCGMASPQSALQVLTTRRKSSPSIANPCFTSLALCCDDLQRLQACCRALRQAYCSHAVY